MSMTDVNEYEQIREDYLRSESTEAVAEYMRERKEEKLWLERFGK